MECCTLTRRDALRMMGVFAGWAFMPKLASAAGGRDPRFLFVVLRGGLDGLAAVAPVADPQYEIAREGLIVPMDGPQPGLPIDGFFALNPNMPVLNRLLKSGEAAIVHATATPYRERSHFDGQDVLESGLPSPARADTGWLNRVLGVLPAGEPVRSAGALAVGPSVPLVVRGPEPVVTWMSVGFPEVATDTRTRLLDLYRHTDPALARAMEEGLKLATVTESEAEMASAMAETADPSAKGAARQFGELATAAGKLLASPSGPRVATLSYPGWDTHRQQGPIEGRLGGLLAALDRAIGHLHRELEPAWQDTVIVLATEFGRTVNMNGTFGTDHGTATIAVVAGGAIKGGRVITDWPGLSKASLHDGRDLRPTIDLRAVLKGLLNDHLGLGERALAETVFPGSESVRPLAGLVA